jgi:hypothetical protein
LNSNNPNLKGGEKPLQAELHGTLPIISRRGGLSFFETPSGDKPIPRRSWESSATLIWIWDFGQVDLAWMTWHPSSMGAGRGALGISLCQQVIQQPEITRFE